MTIYDFPHFREWEHMYECFLSVYQWQPPYLVSSLFEAFLHTVSFFIVAYRYDLLQKRREFLKKFENIFVSFENTYLDKNWNDLRNDLYNLIGSEEIQRKTTFSEELRMDLWGCLGFADMHAIRELKKKKSEQRAVWSQSVYEELWWEDPPTRINEVLEKLRRSCKWIGF